MNRWWSKTKAAPTHLVAVAFGVAAVLFGWGYMRAFEQRVSGGENVTLLATAKPIARGTKLTADMLTAREVPMAYVDERAIRAEEKERVVGLRAATNIPVAQIIEWTDTIAASDDRRDLGMLVQPGNRAFAISIEPSDVLSLVHPGDFVDVVAVLDGKATTLLQRVLVLARGAAVSKEIHVEGQRAGTPRTVTLSVTNEEAQVLALASDRGRVTVLVRNPDDTRVHETIPNLDRESLIETAQKQAGRRERPRSTWGGPTRLGD